MVMFLIALCKSFPCGWIIHTYTSRGLQFLLAIMVHRVKHRTTCHHQLKSGAGAAKCCAVYFSSEVLGGLFCSEVLEDLFMQRNVGRSSFAVECRTDFFKCTEEPWSI